MQKHCQKKELIHRLKSTFYVGPIIVFDSGVVVCRQQLRRSCYSHLCNLRRQRQCPPYDSRHIHQFNDGYFLTAVVVWIIFNVVYENQLSLQGLISTSGCTNTRHCFHSFQRRGVLMPVIVFVHFNIGLRSLYGVNFNIGV